MISLPITPRYAEVDQQGVVFNAHYLTWFDEASTAFFDHLGDGGGLGYPELLASGHDVQLRHTEVDYSAPVRWRDRVRVTAVCDRVGTTSFTLAFEVLRGTPESAEQVAVRGRSVYVVVGTDDWTKRPVPDRLREALSGAPTPSANPVGGQGRPGNRS
ncbi:acyl-CoA thioesterase [Mycolicibacterium thermoresistibile]